jgi:hypothetical protein
MLQFYQLKKCVELVVVVQPIVYHPNVKFTSMEVIVVPEVV